MRTVIFWTVLRPLIVVNYRLRRMRLLPDEWFWADKLAISWGFFFQLPD